MVGTSTYSTSGKSTSGAVGDFPFLTTDRTFRFARGASAYTKTISFSVTNSGSLFPGTSSASISVSVPVSYTAPSVKCKAYRVSASASGYAPKVDPTGTRGYYEITLSGGKNWTLSSGHTLSIGGISCSIAREGTTNTFYGYTLAGAVPEGAKATATASIKLTAMGTTKSVTGTTYISPISNMIDVAPNCVAIGKVASDDRTEMTFEVGCPMYLDGHNSPVGSVFNNTTDTASTMSTTNTWVNKTGCSLSLSPGTWVIKVQAVFRGYTTATGTTNAAAGNRVVGIGYQNASETNSFSGGRAETYAPSGRATYVQSVVMRKLSVDTTVYPMVQTSTQVGFSSARIEAVRIA
ncbi:MAG: hypothetical protein KBS68_04400 [Clostridiales bacterium]|nr:hypothetical protein [Candidatus Crickella merdequi]